MVDATLTATTRTEFGKGAARRLRRAQQVPAVIYGHGNVPVHVALPGHDTMMALKHKNALLEILVDGTKTLTIVKDVQVEPVRQVIEHVDLLVVALGEKIDVNITVQVVGTSAAGTVHMLEAQQLHVEAEATHVPTSIEISVEGLGDGAVLHARDVALPKGVTMLTDPNHVVVSISTTAAAASESE